jgi:hypothetical protein
VKRAYVNDGLLSLQANTNMIGEEFNIDILCSGAFWYGYRDRDLIL